MTMTSSTSAILLRPVAEQGKTSKRRFARGRRLQRRYAGDRRAGYRTTRARPPTTTLVTSEWPRRPGCRGASCPRPVLRSSHCGALRALQDRAHDGEDPQDAPLLERSASTSKRTSRSACQNGIPAASPPSTSRTCRSRSITLVSLGGRGRPVRQRAARRGSHHLDACLAATPLKSVKHLALKAEWGGEILRTCRDRVESALKRYI